MTSGRRDGRNAPADWECNRRGGVVRMGNRKTARVTRLRPLPGRRAARAARVALAMDALEHAVVSGQTDGMQRWAAVLWAHRQEAVAVLLRRLQSRPGRVPGLLLDLLAGLGEDGARPLLRQIAANPLIADLVRLEARRRVGWPAHAGRARATFLGTLRDSVAAVCAAAEMGRAPLPDVEIWQDTLSHVLTLTAPDRVHAIRRIAGLGPEAAWLLRAFLVCPDADSRLAAIEGILASRDRGALPALRRSAPYRPHGATAAAAEIAIRRLTMELVGDRRVSAPRLPPCAQAFVTAVDGRGAQVLSVLRSWERDNVLLVQVVVRDDRGVAAARGSMHLPHDTAVALCQALEPTCEISFAEARAALAWGLERGRTKGKLPPPAFTLWEPFFYENLHPALPEEDVAPLQLGGDHPEPGPRAVAALLAAPCSRGWQFSGGQIATAMRAEERRSARPDVGRILGDLAPPRVLRRWAQRLRRQAWVLDRSGQGSLRDSALGCATALEHYTYSSEAPEPPLVLMGLLTRGLSGPRASGEAPG